MGTTVIGGAVDAKFNNEYILSCFEQEVVCIYSWKKDFWYRISKVLAKLQ